MEALVVLIGVAVIASAWLVFAITILWAPVYRDARRNHATGWQADLTGQAFDVRLVYRLGWR